MHYIIYWNNLQYIFYSIKITVSGKVAVHILVPEEISVWTLCDTQTADKKRFPQVLSYSIRFTFSPASESLDVTFIFPMVTRHTKTAKTPS